MNHNVIIVFYCGLFGDVAEENQPGRNRVGLVFFDGTGIAIHRSGRRHHPGSIKRRREQFAIAAVHDDSVRVDLQHTPGDIAATLYATSPDLFGGRGVDNYLRPLGFPRATQRSWGVRYGVGVGKSVNAGQRQKK